LVQVFILFQNLGGPSFPLDLRHKIKVVTELAMRLRLTKKTRKKLPIDDEKVPLKTKENLEQYLQSAISFLQTQEVALQRSLEILEEILTLAPRLKADVIRKVSKEDEIKSRKRFRELKKELKAISGLVFNERDLFSKEEQDQDFKLFKDASPSAPTIKQPAAPHYLKPVQKQSEAIEMKSVEDSYQALQEMLGQTDAIQSDLKTSFVALATNPECETKLQFIEERVKTWVSEVIEGQDGISVQANIVGKKVDGLIGKIEE